MAAPKVIGRILSLGFPLPGPQVDNYNFLSAPAFFDYDALVVDPHALSLLIEDVIAGSTEAATFTDLPVLNAPASPTSADLGPVLLRRRDETARLLARGGVVVCFTHPPASHGGISGTNPIDDYYWLPDDVAESCRPPALCAADGTQAHIVDDQQPLASFVAGQLANIAYRAHFNERHLTGGRVFARSQGGAAIGIDIASSNGRVVLLPALRDLPSGDARYAMSDALQAGIRRALGVVAAGREPSWLQEYPLAGLDERAASLAVAEATLETARKQFDDAERTFDELARYRRLLWQEGVVGLNEVVKDALRLIGFEVYAQDSNEVELRSGATSILVEIEASERPIDLAPHYRLRQRIEKAIEQRGSAPRGLLIVNGRRLTRPDEREGEVTDALRLAAETMRYAVAPTSGLFAAVAAQFGGRIDDVAAYRCRVASEDGVLGDSAPA